MYETIIRVLTAPEDEPAAEYDWWDWLIAYGDSRSSHAEFRRYKGAYDLAKEATPLPTVGDVRVAFELLERCRYISESYRTFVNRNGLNGGSDSPMAERKRRQYGRVFKRLNARLEMYGCIFKLYSYPRRYVVYRPSKTSSVYDYKDDYISF